MSDLIRREDVIKQIEYHQNHKIINKIKTKYALEMVKSSIEELPTAEPKEYVKDGTLTVQMPTIKEAKAIDKIVVYADTYRQEYYMPLPKVGKWIDHSDEGYVQCPFCGSLTTCEDNIDELHYCFNCGAKMERRADEADKSD